MPTPPSDHARTPAPESRRPGPASEAHQASSALEPHRARGIAESFGVDPDRYDRTRQPYPEALVQRCIDQSPGTDVLDVGCGTGIAARQFQVAGCRVLGLEPDSRMAAFAQHRGLEVEVSMFEAWNPRGRSFDLIVAGTAWHWIDPAAGAVKAARVLRPGGRWAAFWHVWEAPPTVHEAFAEAYTEAVPDSPFDPRALPGKAMDTYQVMCDTAADGIRQVDRFEEPEQWRFDWERPYTRDEYLDQLPTTGALTRATADQVAHVLARVGAAIDALGGVFTTQYTTVAVTAVAR